MDLSQIQPPLNQFLQAVSSRIKVDQMIIFGSYLEGTAREDSDIDVVVVSEDFKKLRADKRTQVLDQAARFIRPEIQAWGLTNEEMEAADELTTFGYARTSGIRFI